MMVVQNATCIPLDMHSVVNQTELKRFVSLSVFTEQSTNTARWSNLVCHSNLNEVETFHSTEAHWPGWLWAVCTSEGPVLALVYTWCD